MPTTPPANISGGHWYCPKTGQPRHFVEKKDGSGLRATTLADARKQGWLPSVTTITKCLAAPALTEWLRKEAAMAVATTPRGQDEALDAFVDRCLAIDAQSSSDAAKELGTRIHDGIEKSLGSGIIEQNEITEFVAFACSETLKLGRVVATEKILIGQGYAGKTDCIVENEECITVIDFKTTGAKKLPKESYNEHRLQLAAYAGALGNTGTKRIQTANIYISTVRPGEVSVCRNVDCENDLKAFKMVQNIWQWLNDFNPQTESVDWSVGITP